MSNNNSISDWRSSGDSNRNMTDRQNDADSKGDPDEDIEIAKEYVALAYRKVGG